MPRPSRARDVEAAVFHRVGSHPEDLVRVVADELGLSRAAVVRHVNRLVEEGYLAKQGTTRPTYVHGVKRKARLTYELEGLAEDIVWSNDLAPLLHGVPRNVIEICHYGITEMVNNAVDHSEGKELIVRLDVNEEKVILSVTDDGVGIFRKITEHLSLPDERLALLELAKGKLTTDPIRHTGEGIFFTSKAFDEFWIFSGDLTFGHHPAVSDDDWLLESNKPMDGTAVVMHIQRSSKTVLRDIFSKYSSGPDDYSFEKTIVPVRLARIGDENLISRSQAKRLISRFDKFRNIILDFEGVEMVGQAFADEIFRVFARAHPGIELIPSGARPEVQEMINRALRAE